MAWLPKIGRRGFLAGGVAAGASGITASMLMNQSGKADDFDDAPTVADFGYTPYTQELPVPPVLRDKAESSFPRGIGQLFHRVAPEWYAVNNFEGFEDYEFAANIIRNQTRFPPKMFLSRINEATHQFFPGVETPIFGYESITPGPTIMARFGEPVIVRYINRLHAEVSVHAHGGHWPAHSDGYPDHYVLPGQTRDYYYPNIVPLENGQPDYNEAMSTMWYHDHGMDITGHNVTAGLVGFFLTTDELERQLIDDHVLPWGNEPYDISGYGVTDIPLALSDKRFNSDGSLFYDFLDHDGNLGNIWTVNGKAQPYMRVQRKKYRFRILAVGTARTWAIRMNRGRFITIGSDSWLLPNAIQERTITLGVAQRADVVYDFGQWPAGEEIYLENVMAQDDGRGPDGIDEDIRPRQRLMKFIVEGPSVPASQDASVQVGTPLRPNTPIHADEIHHTRHFVFERGNGAWKINDLFFDPERADAVPLRGSAERWILENSSGGWWHPIHIHLESHQVQSHTNGDIARPRIGYKSDTTLLGENGVAEIFMKFRTYTGPFVFHCHNLEHEDMRMMTSFDPRDAGTTRPLNANGFPERPQECTGNFGFWEDRFGTPFADANFDHDRFDNRDQGLRGEIAPPT